MAKKTLFRATATVQTYFIDNNGDADEYDGAEALEMDIEDNGVNYNLVKIEEVSRKNIPSKDLSVIPWGDETDLTIRQILEQMEGKQ